ncbi:hypothetical protein BECAL_00567 [Bellilinea caldifistulae]|uniref:Uncharacterized protein n=1 Tax=Bellilinea caldifistulae TaxID=360411 RepID=A0A0P6X5I5_9CHLR|nr:hypothetical protein [Bellilinea caldifistulae]KPL75268.1 hypothetical protein AC812_10000 [Bellilinea caldifistulae]GAP09423.1 hypothetical protein BECAL_00567 [Bellilinea caldifistulae]
MRSPTRRPILWLAALLGALLLVGGSILSARGQFNPQQGDSGGGWLTTLLEQISERSQSAVNPAEQALLEEKLNRLQQIQEARQSAGLLAAPTLTLGVCPPPESTPATVEQPEGIFELEDQGDYEDLDFMAVNGWSGSVNGNFVTVMAGRRFSEPAGGMLVLFTVNAPIQKEPAPVPSSLLRIMAADSYRLTLADEQGRVFYFDVAARRWLTAPDEVVPTLPPIPTFTPQAVPCP